MICSGIAGYHTGPEEPPDFESSSWLAGSASMEVGPVFPLSLQAGHSNRCFGSVFV